MCSVKGLVQASLLANFFCSFDNFPNPCRQMLNRFWDDHHQRTNTKYFLKTITWWMVELPLVLTSQLLIIPSQGHLQVK
jgi:hypothetical protein